MEVTIFDKNHIKVMYGGASKTEGKFRVAWTTFSERIFPKGMSITTIKEKWEDVVKESPLGFYYESKQKVAYEEQTPMSVSIHYHQIYVYLSTKYYRIIYPVSCNDVKIGFDARPWDICIGDMTMRENFIKALNKILDEIFVSAAPIKGIARTKEKVYTEVFGNTNGYSTVDNEIKILSHGFDPKESFRKVKKKKK
jgi:hypothetical protein